MVGWLSFLFLFLPFSLLINLFSVSKTTKTFNLNKPDAALAQNQLISQFRNYLKTVENSVMRGWNPKTKRWMPHKSVERTGMRTLAYGHKFDDAKEQADWYRANPNGRCCRKSIRKTGDYCNTILFLWKAG